MLACHLRPWNWVRSPIFWHAQQCVCRLGHEVACSLFPLFICTSFLSLSPSLSLSHTHLSLCYFTMQSTWQRKAEVAEGEKESEPKNKRGRRERNRERERERGSFDVMLLFTIQRDLPALENAASNCYAVKRGHKEPGLGSDSCQPFSMLAFTPPLSPLIIEREKKNKRLTVSNYYSDGYPGVSSNKNSRQMLLSARYFSATVCTCSRSF